MLAMAGGAIAEYAKSYQKNALNQCYHSSIILKGYQLIIKQMIIVHDIFVCKPGNASKVAKLFKETVGKEEGVVIMTDMTGQWHRVIMSSVYENLTDYEEKTKKMMADTAKNRKMNKKFKGMNDMYLSGSREIYKVW